MPSFAHTHTQKKKKKKKKKKRNDTNVTTIAATTATTISKQPSKGNLGQVQSKTNDHSKTDEGWTEVTRRKKKPPKPGETSSAATSPLKKPEAAPATRPASDSATPEPIAETPLPKSEPASTSESTPASPTKMTSFSKTPTPAKVHQPVESQMEATVNLKRRKGSGEDATLTSPAASCPATTSPTRTCSPIWTSQQHYQPSYYPLSTST